MVKKIKKKGKKTAKATPAAGASPGLGGDAAAEDGVEVVPAAAGRPEPCDWSPEPLEEAPRRGKKGRKRKAASGAGPEQAARQKDLTMLEEVLKQDRPTEEEEEDEEDDIRGADFIPTPGAKDLKVFVGGLPWDAEAETVRRDFAECGAIASFDMPKGADGQPMGVAFIVYRTKEGADSALAFDGDEYFGRKIRVKLSNPPRQGKGKGKGKGKKGKGKGKAGGGGKGKGEARPSKGRQ